MNKKEELNNTKKQKKEIIYDIKPFSIKKYFFDSSFEKKVQEILCSIISDEFIILPHVGFREIFKWDWEGIDKNLNNSVTKMHFDFGVYDKWYRPIMFVEIWGSDHQKDSQTKKIDAFKKKLLKKCGLKLVIIDASKKIQEEKIKEKVLQQIKEQIPSNKDYPVYCLKCHSRMNLISNKKKGTSFYGCSTYKRGEKNTCPIRWLPTVPPLYKE